MTRIKRMTEQELQVLLAKQHPIAENTDEADSGPESELQSVIKAFCKQKGWPVLAFPQTRQVMTFLPPGWPDINIKLPFGSTLEIETKSYSGKLRHKQKENQLIWLHLGHTIHLVKSFRKFLQIVEKATRRE